MALNPSIYGTEGVVRTGLAAVAPARGFNPNAGTLNPDDRSSNTYASDTLARLTRDRYSDYLRRFRGIENEQIAYATDQGKPLAEAQNAISTVQGSFGRIAGQQERRASRLGLDATAPDVAASLNRSTAIAGGLAAVTGANRAAQQTYDRQNAIFSGSAGNSLPTGAR